MARKPKASEPVGTVGRQGAHHCLSRLARYPLLPGFLRRPVNGIADSDSASVPASKVASRFDRSRMAVPTLAEPFGGVGYRPRHNHHAPAGAEDARAVERVELNFSVLDVHNEAMRQAALDLGEPIAGMRAMPESSPLPSRLKPSAAIPAGRASGHSSWTARGLPSWRLRCRHRGHARGKDR